MGGAAAPAADGLCDELHHDWRQPDRGAVAALFDALPVPLFEIPERYPAANAGKPRPQRKGWVFLRGGFRDHGLDPGDQCRFDRCHSSDGNLQPGCLEADPEPLRQCRGVSSRCGGGGNAGAPVVLVERDPAGYAQPGVPLRLCLFRGRRGAGESSLYGSGSGLSAAAPDPLGIFGGLPGEGLEMLAVLWGLGADGVYRRADGQRLLPLFYLGHSQLGVCRIPAPAGLPPFPAVAAFLAGDMPVSELPDRPGLALGAMAGISAPGPGRDPIRHVLRPDGYGGPGGL